MTLSRRKVGFVVAAVMLCVAIACKDNGAPVPTEPVGRYELQTVGGVDLPYVTARYLSGDWEEISEGSLRVLSRGRLIITAVIDSRSPNGSLKFQKFDTLTFTYSRSGDLVVLGFQHFNEISTDTLQLLEIGENAGLHALSDNYRRTTLPITLVNGALYLK